MQDKGKDLKTKRSKSKTDYKQKARGIAFKKGEKKARKIFYKKLQVLGVPVI